MTTFDLSTETAFWANNAGAVTSWQNVNGDLVSWTFGTPPGTIFDGGSLQFNTPVDMYSNTTVYNKYLLFPKRTITQDIVQVNQIYWINDYNELITWVSNSDEPVIWTGVGPP
jgi:hypothetical protein